MNTRWLIEKIAQANKSYPQFTFEHHKKIYTCVNPYSYHIVRKNIDIYSQFDGIFVDGILMCIFLRIIAGKKIRRLSFDMTSIANDLFQHASIHHQSIYFIGSSQDKIEQSIKVIANSFPDLNIIGFRNGYFNSLNDRQDSIENIRRINPDYLIIGMGSPLQEEFAMDLKKAGYKGIAFTCGGFLHQTSEGINYYPKWINKLNLRGFYRQYKEKILIRNYNTFIQFPFLYILDTIKTKLKIF